MTVETFNRARFDALCIAAEAGAAGLPALADAARHAADLVRLERGEARRMSPLPDRNTDVDALAAEHARVLADDRHNPDHAAQIRLALAAARRAVAAEARAAALQAEVDRRAAELRPLQELVRACRRYVGQDSMPAGVAR